MLPVTLKDPDATLVLTVHLWVMCVCDSPYIMFDPVLV